MKFGAYYLNLARKSTKKNQYKKAQTQKDSDFYPKMHIFFK